MSDDTSETSLEAVRREKMQRVADLGCDPWGQRFDNRDWIGDIRQRTAEIKLHLESGGEVDVPALIDGNLADNPTVAFRQWMADQGKGELRGPKVRAAGRIMLHRDKGKLQFIDIQDWTGRVQLFVGQAQVGEENWQLVNCLDLGDIIGVDGELKITKTG
ncbi:MAG: hypothetical protein KDA62_20860, partial [Planctomycetales bacterium]|nr:hypothetical protein [Planctomycetales bacterium]